MTGLDTRLFRDVNHLAQHSPWAHAPLAAFARYGIVLFALLLVVAWWRARRSRPGPARVAVVVAVALCAGAALLANVGLSDLVARPRPFVALPHVTRLIPHGRDWSFPSDHCAVAGAVTAGLWLLRRDALAVIATLAALLMAFSRVYVGVHYPGDVLGGLLLGGLVVLVLAAGLSRLLQPVARWLAGTWAWWLVSAQASATRSA